MLKELRIRNFALIDYLSVCFDPGLNILTGETGAGKTILINALNLLLGSRASSEYIRSGADSAEVEAAFHIENGHPIYKQLESSGYPCTPDEDLIIRRVIFRSEKANRSYLNGHIVHVGLLVDIGAWLVDMHGQHEHQILLNTAHHIEILDHFGGLEKDTEHVALAYSEYHKTRQKMDNLRQKKEESKREHDLIGFQREEIDRANLRPGEKEELLKQRDILAHAIRIQELVYSVDSVLYQSEGSVCEALGEAIYKIRELSNLDPYFTPLGETLNSILIQIEDISRQFRDYTVKTDFSPQHLEEVEERLDQISRLEKKYKLTLDEIIKLRHEIESRWQLLEDYEGLIKAHSIEMDEKWADLSKKASQLSLKRRQWAKKIEQEIEEQLKDLEMNKAKFLVEFSQKPSPESGPPKNLTARGWDEIEFIFSANVGEEPKPLVKIASGGEISRVMLALKSCLARADQVLTLVFDEIDTGIGGKTAIKVGQKMKHLTQKCQIICITHLPQIACNADAHYLVTKKVKDSRTLTVVDRLSRSQQIEELAKMIAGDGKSEIAIQHAKEMLEKSTNLL